jgi:ABC-type glycerol-3-phosphate transport system substrate-binding protein
MKRGLGIVFAGMLVVSACTGTTATPTPAPASATPAAGSATPAAGSPGASGSAAAGGNHLVVWTRNYTVADGKPSPYRDAKAKFEAAHPGWTVDLTGVGYDDQYNRLLLSQAGSVSDKPDVMQIDNIWLGQFTENGMLANLDSYYANWSGKDDIVDAYKNSTIWNGHQQAVWGYGDIRLLLWNKDVFTAAGLDPEVGPKTWDDVFADCEKIKASNQPGVSAVGFPAASQEGTADRYYSYLFMTGSTILAPDNKSAVFNDAGGQKATQFMVDLVNKGCTPQDVLNQDADAVQDATFAGKYGMMLATVGDGFGSKPAAIADADYSKHFGAIVPPICSDGCQPATTAGGWMIGINAASDKKDMAWEYILDVTDGPSIVPFEAAYVRIPVRKSGLAMPDAFKADPYYSESVKAAGLAHFPPFVAQYTAMLEPIWTGLQTAIQGTPVKDALDQAKKDTDAILNPPQ